MKCKIQVKGYLVGQLVSDHHGDAQLVGGWGLGLEEQACLPVGGQTPVLHRPRLEVRDGHQVCRDQQHNIYLDRFEYICIFSNLLWTYHYDCAGFNLFEEGKKGKKLNGTMIFSIHSMQRIELFLLKVIIEGVPTRTLAWLRSRWCPMDRVSFTTDSWLLKTSQDC